ncbi:hypothetical protein EV2_046094 [Malus domestica]
MFSLHTIGALIKERATGSLVQKSKRHHSPDFEEAPLSTRNISSSDWQKCPTFTHISENTTNKITCSKIEKAPLSESREPNSQQDYVLKNRKGTALRISRARLPTGLISQKSKRYCSPNLKSQTPNRIAFSKIEDAPLFESREPDSQQDYVFKNRRGTALRISRARLPTGLLSQKSKRHCSPNLKSQTPNRIAFSKIEEAPFSESQEPDPRQDCLLENRRGTALRTSKPDFLG